MLADLRLALRALVRAPGFTVVAILTLALGIGATSAIFSVVHGVLLKPLPFAEPGRLVSLMHRSRVNGPDLMNQGAATYFTYLDHQRAFEAIGAWDTRQVSITGRGEPERVTALAASATTLPLLGVRPARGRLFTADEDAPGAPLRVVLTHGYWQRRFGAAADVVGQTLTVGDQAAVVVGVLPASFRFLRAAPAVVMPLRLDRAEAGEVSFGFQALGRLKPGVTLTQANADVARMIALLPPAFAMFELGPGVRPLADDVVGSLGEVLWVLLAAVGVVLLIACVNVANLLLIRAEGRQHEFALRAALGASRGRVARAVLAESGVLALAAGALAVLLAHGAVALLRRLAPAHLPRVDEIAVDPTVLLFTAGVAAAAGLLAGLVTVARFGAPSATALREGGRGASDGPRRQRTRDALVVSEVAMALVLLVVSGLMVRTFVALRQVDPGFVRPEAVQTFRVALAAPDTADDARVARTHQAIAERLAAVPGVASVGLSSHITMDGEDNTNPLYVEGVPVPAGALPPLRRYKTVAPRFFETMGIRLVAGRTVTWADIAERRPVVVVSEALAREHWREPSRAIGKRVRGDQDTPWREVVGVVGDERDDGLDKPATPIVYWPLLDDTYRPQSMAFAVRSGRVGDPGFVRDLQRAVWAVDPNAPVAAVRTLDEIQADSMARTSFAMVLLAVAAGMALFLGLVGVYGVIAYAASRRTREIGIRMALGARAASVRRLFLRDGLALAGVGIALGVVASLALTRVMTALLFGVAPTDPLTFAAASAGLAAVALFATWLPARRAARVDPAVVLRAEG
jgi:predicted permease